MPPFPLLPYPPRMAVWVTMSGLPCAVVSGSLRTPRSAYWTRCSSSTWFWLCFPSGRFTLAGLPSSGSWLLLGYPAMTQGTKPRSAVSDIRCYSFPLFFPHLFLYKITFLLGISWFNLGNAFPLEFTVFSRISVICPSFPNTLSVSWRYGLCLKLFVTLDTLNIVDSGNCETYMNLPFREC